MFVIHEHIAVQLAQATDFDDLFKETPLSFEESHVSMVPILDQLQVVNFFTPHLDYNINIINKFF